MNEERFQEQVDAYVMGELDPEQTVVFEHALAADGVLRRLLRERGEDLERLTLKIAPQVEPPAAVRDRLLAATAADLRARAHPVDTNTERGFSLDPRSNAPAASTATGWAVYHRRAFAGGIALAVLVVCAVLWTGQARARHENDALRARLHELATENAALHAARDESAALRETRERLEGEIATWRRQAENGGREAAAASEQLARTRQDLLAARGQDIFNRLQVGSLQPPPGTPPPTVPAAASAAGGIALWDPVRQQGMLVVENLPMPRADQDYQVWVADPSRPQPVPSGVFHPARAGSQQTLRFITNERIERAVQFMVTLERKGGVNHITGPAVLESLPRR